MSGRVSDGRDAIAHTSATEPTELRAAAEVLGLHGLELLNYIDGQLDHADPAEVIAKIVWHLRRVRPQVVITFGPDGSTGHPDHIAICQFTTAAIVCAADPCYMEAEDASSHRVSKLYYMAPSQETLAVYQAAFGALVLDIDGRKRYARAWEDWAITTRIDTSAHWQQVWNAVACHRTQLPGYEILQQLPAEQHRRLWGSQEYYRAFSLVNGGRLVERDLFAGLR